MYATQRHRSNFYYRVRKIVRLACDVVSMPSQKREREGEEKKKRKREKKKKRERFSSGTSQVAR